MGLRRLFRTRIGFHQTSVTLSRTHHGHYQKDLVQVSGQALTRTGLFAADLILGERVPGQNTLCSHVAISWSGPVLDQNVTLQLSQARSDGSAVLEQPREDRITRLSVEAPFSRLDLGLYAERRSSTIDAYDLSNVGVTAGLRFDLLR